MNSSRGRTTAIELPTGKVLVAGGVDASREPQATGELYDPALRHLDPHPGHELPSRLPHGHPAQGRHRFGGWLRPQCRALRAIPGTRAAVTLALHSTSRWEVSDARSGPDRLCFAQPLHSTFRRGHWAEESLPPEKPLDAVGPVGWPLRVRPLSPQIQPAALMISELRSFRSASRSIRRTRSPDRPMTLPTSRRLIA